MQAKTGERKPTPTRMQAYELEMVLPLWEPNSTDAKPRNVRVVCKLAPSLDCKIYEETEAAAMLLLMNRTCTPSPSTVTEPLSAGATPSSSDECE